MTEADEYRRVQDASTRLLDAEDLDGAEPLVHDALARAKKLFPKTHAEIADCLHNLAFLHRARGRVEEALAAWEEALRVQRALGDSQRASAADTLGHMANMLVMHGDYARAKPIAKRATSELRVTDPRGEDYAIALADLAKCLHESGDFAGARALYDEAIPIFDERESRVFASASRLSRGTASLRLGEGDRAIADYEDTLREQEAREDCDPADLDETLASLFDAKTQLGVKVLDGGDHARGKALLDGALEIAERRKKNADRMTALTNASAAAGLCGDLSRAGELAQRAVDLGRKLGLKAPLAIALYRRGNAHVLGGKCADAVPLLERAVQIVARGKDWEWQMECQRLLGVALHGVEEYGRAARALEAALAIAKRHRADDLRILDDLVTVYRDFDENARALPYAEERARKIAKVSGREGAEYADAIEQLAHVLDDLEDAGATKLYEEVLAIRERLVPSSEDLAIAWENLGLHRANHGDHERADDAFMRGLAIREALFGADGESTSEMLEDAKESLGDDLAKLPRLAARIRTAESRPSACR